MVHVVSAVDCPIVLALAVAANRETNYVDSALRVGRAHVHLIGRVAGYTRLESNQLLIIAVIQRQFANLRAANEAFYGNILEIDLKRVGFDGYSFRNRAGL